MVSKAYADGMFVLMLCFHIRWHALCLSLWVLVTVVFFSDAELSALCCHLIPIIRFVLLCISEMKRLVVTRKACNQHEGCQTEPKLTSCVCEKKKLLAKMLQRNPQGKEQGGGGVSKTIALHALWLKIYPSCGLLWMLRKPRHLSENREIL